jgi:uncharacterized protein with HEPN domain
MSERLPELFLLDIVVAAAKIGYVADQHENGDDLKHDFTHWDTVIREFEIIGEATNRLIKMALLSESERKIVDFRNLIAHEYFGILPEAVMDVIRTHLPPFVKRVEEVFRQWNSPYKTEALEWLHKENAHLPFVIEKLETLKGEPQ